MLDDLFKALLHKLMTGEIRVADLDLSALGQRRDAGGRSMSDLKISEAGTVQFPMVKHAAEIGWTPIGPEVAKQKRGGEAGMLLRDELEAKLREFNPWLTDDAIRSIIETLDAIPPTIEGNREMLSWLRGERQWYDENEKRHRRVTLIDFEHTDANVFHVSWEWTLKPPARKGNRADVMFRRQRRAGLHRRAQEPEGRRRHRARASSSCAATRSRRRS